MSGIISFTQTFNFLAFSGEQDHASEAYRTTVKSAIGRGGSRFRRTRSLYNFEASYKIKYTKLRNKKLGRKGNIYLESKQKSRKITDLKQVSKCYKHQKMENNNNIILSIDCQT